MPYCRPVSVNAFPSSRRCSGSTGRTSGKFRFVFSYRSTKLITAVCVYPSRALAIYSKARICLSAGYASLINTGSYRQPMRSGPTMSESRRKLSSTSRLSGTRGSISFPYGVMVTYQYCPYSRSRSIRGIMGAGFFVQKPIRSTTSGESRYRVTETGLYGFRTSTKPAFSRLANHSE